MLRTQRLAPPRRTALQTRLEQVQTITNSFKEAS